MKRILIVDDSAFMRAIIKDIAEKKCAQLFPDGFEIEEAGSGVEALAKLKIKKFDYAFLDIIMPEGDEEGILLLGEIHKEYHSLQVVMITSLGQERIVKECQNLGAKGFISKPFDKEQVEKMLEELAHAKV